MDTFTEGVRAALAAMGGTKLSQCQRLGISVVTLDRWRAGAGKPSERSLARLARVSGMSQETIRSGGTEVPEC